MGCMVCNPFCGRCRPPQPRPTTCAQCGQLAIAARDKPWVCNHCGATLPPRPKLRCNWSGRMCDIPCMYNTKKNPSGELHPCRWPSRKATKGTKAAKNADGAKDTRTTGAEGEKAS